MFNIFQLEVGFNIFRLEVGFKIELQNIRFINGINKKIVLLYNMVYTHINGVCNIK